MSGSQNKLTFKEKSGISFIAQDDPPFIQQMKKKLGYKAPPKIEDKYTEDDPTDTPDDPETELLHTKQEERPQVVVLNPETDLSQEDLDKALDNKQKEEDDKKIVDGKIKFRKPEKRCLESGDETSKVEEKKRAIRTEEKPQSRLLSFGDDEDED